MSISARRPEGRHTVLTTAARKSVFRHERREYPNNTKQDLHFPIENCSGEAASLDTHWWHPRPQSLARIKTLHRPDQERAKFISNFREGKSFPIAQKPFSERGKIIGNTDHSAPDLHYQSHPGNSPVLDSRSRFFVP